MNYPHLEWAKYMRAGGLRPRKPLNFRGLRVLEAVVRNGSIKAAAEELGVTSSAISHQMRSLRHQFGDELIVNSRNGLAPTNLGRRISESLSKAFGMIERQIDNILIDRSVLRIGTYSSFGVDWLIPRIAEFSQLNPKTDYRLVMLSDPHELDTNSVDIFITSERKKQGFYAKKLFTEWLVPVAHRDLVESFPQNAHFISSEADDATAGKAWERFASLNEFDLPPLNSQQWSCCSHYIFAIGMAVASMGIALVPDYMAESRIADGTLVRIPGRASPSGEHYFIQVPTDRRHEFAIKNFIGWLEREISEDHLINDISVERLSLSHRTDVTP